MVARIREEGLQRSQLANTLSFMTDVLGARLTNSLGMERAQQWAIGQMRQIGLENTIREPFMDYGVSWDNEYVSLHMMEPDYQPMVGYPVAHTPGTTGKVDLEVVIADVQTRQDLEQFRGRLGGMAVLSTPPAAVDLQRFSRGTPRRTDEELRALEESVILPASSPDAHFSRLYPDPPANPDVLTAWDRLNFYESEGVAAVLESNSGWPGAVRGFARPDARTDRWSREGTLGSVPLIAVTPEHYNRMYRILARGIPVTIEAEVRNRVGEQVEPASNILGEIAGSDLADEVVMLGAHFDTWHASPNASDNTSGVAVILEAMRILKAVGTEPRRTIRVALWSGEEQGLFGSRAYVMSHEVWRPQRPPRRHQARLREVLRLLQPGLRTRPVPWHLATGQRARTRDVRRVDGAVPGPWHDNDLASARGKHGPRAVRCGRTPGLSVPPGPRRRNGRPHQPRLLRHDAARRSDEERGDHGILRLSRGDDRRADSAEGAGEVTAFCLSVLRRPLATEDCLPRRPSHVHSERVDQHRQRPRRDDRGYGRWNDRSQTHEQDHPLDHAHDLAPLAVRQLRS